LREYDGIVWKRWGEYVVEQRREMDGLGVPYMGIDTDSKEKPSAEEDENRKKLLSFIEDIITEIPPYPAQYTTSSLPIPPSAYLKAYPLHHINLHLYDSVNDDPKAFCPTRHIDNITHPISETGGITLSSERGLSTSISRLVS
jgi:hypothetical protein